MPLEDPEWGPFLEAAFLAVLETSNDGLVVFDADGVCRMIGRKAGELFGVEPAAYVGKKRGEVFGAFARSAERPEAFLRALDDSESGPAKTVGEFELVKPRLRTAVWTTVPITRGSKTWGRLVVVKDVTRERASERIAKQLSIEVAEHTPVDAATGVFNMRRFREELEREHGRSARAWDTYGVLRVQIPKMQEIIDVHGVAVGDAVLARVAGALKASKREYDIVARIEGEDFVLLLPGADKIAAKAVADRVASSVEAGEYPVDSEVTVLVGGAVWQPPSGEGGEDILRLAGEAMKTGASEVTITVSGPAEKA